MAEEVYLDIPEVENISKELGVVSDVLTNVHQVLDALSSILKGTAFIGLVGGYALAKFIDAISPQVKRVAEECAELERDVNASVRAYERGDAMGATRFH